MKVSMWYSNADIRLEERPTPSPGPGEILAKVHACGICGSDVVEWYRAPRAPLVQGHEVGAEVVECGAGVEGFSPGDRIFVAPKVPCGECRLCRAGHFPQCTEIKGRLPGGFAEFLLVPADIVTRGAYRLPDALSYDAATFIEPLACVVRAQEIAGIEAGQGVLVLGSGLSGALHVKEAVRRGCTVAVTDVSAARLEYSRRAGAKATIDAAADVPAEVERLLGRQADVVIVTTGARPAIEQAWASVGKGGAVVFFAVPGPGAEVTIPIHGFWMQEIRVLTSYYCGPPDIRAAIGLLERQEIEVLDLVTHRLPLTRAAEGFAMMLDGGDSMKILVHPHAVS